MSRNMINIQSDEFVKIANKLEKIGRADLPVAVRGTLNNMAFKMKGTGGQRGQIDKRAEKEFDYRRNRSLFKAITGVGKAKGLNINNMQSEAGIINRSGMNEVAQGLADQQKGGDTDQKITPLTKSRIGKSTAKKVRGALQLRKLNSVDLRNKKGNRKIAAMIKAKRDRRTILIEGKGGVKLIARVKGFKRGRAGVKFKLDWLYRINDNGKVNLKKKRPFVNNAAKDVMKDMSKEFVKQAKIRIQKSMR